MEQQHSCNRPSAQLNLITQLSPIHQTERVRGADAEEGDSGDQPEVDVNATSTHISFGPNFEVTEGQSSDNNVLAPPDHQDSEAEEHAQEQSQEPHSNDNQPDSHQDIEAEEHEQEQSQEPQSNDNQPDSDSSNQEPTAEEQPHNHNQEEVRNQDPLPIGDNHHQEQPSLTHDSVVDGQGDTNVGPDDQPSTSSSPQKDTTVHSNTEQNPSIGEGGGGDGSGGDDSEGGNTSETWNAPQLVTS